MPNLVKNLKTSCKDVFKDKILLTLLVIIAVVAVNQIVFSVLLEDRQAAQAGAVLGTDTVGGTAYLNGGLRTFSSTKLPFESYPKIILVDDVNDFVYVVTTYGQNQIVKIDPTTGARLGGFYLDSDDIIGNKNGIIDTARGFIYLGTNNSSGNAKVVKININDGSPIGMTRVGSINISTDSLGGAVYDPVNQFAYYGTTASPAEIIKVNLNDGGAPLGMSLVGSIPLIGTENNVQGGVIDVANQYAYFGTNTNPVLVVKVNLNDGGAPNGFSRSAVLTLTGESGFRGAAVMDPPVIPDIPSDHGYAYFSPYSSDNVIKIDIDNTRTFSIVDTLDLSTSGCWGNTTTGVIDVVNQFAYFTGNASNFCKIDVDNSNFSFSAVDTGGTNYDAQAAIDPVGGYAYFASGGIPTMVSGQSVVLRTSLSVFDIVEVARLRNNEHSLDCAVIDTANGYAYYAINNSGYTVGVRPARIIKQHLESGQFVGSISLTPPENHVVSCAKDPSTNFAYFGTTDHYFPASRTAHNIVKIDLNDITAPNGFSRVGSKVSAPGDGSLASLVIDDVDNFAYFGTDTDPANIVKVNLNDGGDPLGFSIVGTKAMTGHEDFQSAVIDTVSGYAYFGTTPFMYSEIVKVNVRDGGAPLGFSEAAFITLDAHAGDYKLQTAVIDPVNNYAYFGTFSGPARVVKIDINHPTFSRVGSVQFLSGENFIYSAAIDVSSSTAVFGMSGVPAKFVIMDLNDLSAPDGFSRSGTMDVPTHGGNHGRGGVADVVNKFMYFGTEFEAPLLPNYNGQAYKLSYSKRGYVNASKINAASTISEINYFDFYSHTADGNLRLALYDSGKNLLWESGSVANTTAGDWIRVSVSPALTNLAAGDYWLAWQTDSASNVGSYTAGGAGDGFYLPATFGAFPSAISGDISTDEVWSMSGGVSDLVRSGGAGGGNAVLPNAPINMSCQALSTNTIRWSFEDTASNETGFRLYGPTGLILDSGPDVVMDLSYIDETGLLPNVLYSDRYVTTYSGSGESVPSNLASCTTLADGDPLPSPEITALPENIEVGDVLQGLNSPEIYLVSSVNQKRLFPTEVIYNSWFEDYANIKQVSEDTLSQIALGPNMILRPGTWLMKITTDPKVYAVEPNGVIRWIETEAVALSLYGVDWSKRVIDMPDVYFVDYVEGESINTSQYTTGSLLQYKGTSDIYYIENGSRRLVSPQAFTQNYFQQQFVITNIDPLKYELTEGDAFPVDYDYTMTMTQQNRSRSRR
ncbi:hypothetical protein ACFL2U_00925 [Patescibacteria group bacterium]